MRHPQKRHFGETHRVADTVAQVYTGVAKADTSKGSGQPVRGIPKSVRVRLADRPCKTYIICESDSWSSGFFAIRGRCLMVVWRAHMEKTSATGLLP